MGNVSILSEFWDFLKHRKKWWLAPITIMLVLLSFLIIFTEGSALAPFIYAISDRQREFPRTPRRISPGARALEHKTGGRFCDPRFYVRRLPRGAINHFS